ncbi:MAG: DUF5658 family protein [Candidatus Aminicenantes bacterium]|nr:DUF5658 family protein [Candidatus Aminicenantes bacterium]
MKTAIAVLIIVAVMATVPAWGLQANAAARILETPLPATVRSPLVLLDLFPDPAPKPRTNDASLRPDQLLRDPGHRYLYRGPKGSAVGNTMFDVSLAAWVGLSLADYLTTTAALKYPSLAESNPVFKLFVNSPLAFAAAKIGLTAFSYWGIKRLYKQNKVLAWILSTAANFTVSFVINNNARLIKEAKGR